MTHTETEVENQESITSETILQDVIDGAIAHAAASDDFIENFIFFNKSLKEWAEKLVITVPVTSPDNPITPAQMQQLFAKLANNIQITNHFYTIANSISNALNSGGSVKKADLISAIIKSYEKKNVKRPGVDAIDKMAESYMSHTIPAKIAAKLVRDFFRDKYDTLVEVRKCLEAINMSLNMELKYIEGGHND